MNMTHAQVRDPGPLTVSAPANAGSRIEMMCDLLRRYPSIEEKERMELLTFLTDGPPDEINQVIFTDGVDERYRAFRKAHPDVFPVGITAWLPIILFVLIAVGGLVWRLVG